MRKALNNSLLFVWALLLVSCESTDLPTENYKLPPTTFNVSFVVDEGGSIRQLNYSVQANPEEMASVKQLENELISNGFTRCDSGDDWFGFAKEAGHADNVKRHTRFYRGENKYRLAVLGVDQTCKSEDGGKCTHVTTLVFNVFPWWMIGREGTIKQICSASVSN
jgi:hypothetical protein